MNHILRFMAVTAGRMYEEEQEKDNTNETLQQQHGDQEDQRKLPYTLSFSISSFRL